MSKINQEITLYGWQQDILSNIDKFEDIRESEQYQGIPDYQINRSLSTTVVFPKGSGHTFLANYIASKYATILIYGNVKHLNEVTERFSLHKNTETLSMYEIFFALFKPDIKQPCVELLALNKKFTTNCVVVVDNYMRVPQAVRDYILNCAKGPIVFLGH